MRRVALAGGADLDGFRRAARGLLAEGVPPEQVQWIDGDAGADLFGGGAPVDATPLRLPRAAVDLIRLVVCHRDPVRFALLYQLIWRLGRGERALLERASDPLVHRLARMERAIRRDRHKMHAFVRFRKMGIDPDGVERYAAWFEPDHHIVELASPFFKARFPAFRWSILTPLGSAHWDREVLRFGPPGNRDDVPGGDAWEAGWGDYYASSFNPARVNPRMMMSEMPRKYWKNLPEAALIPGLLRGADARTRAMIEAEAGTPAKRAPAKALERLYRERQRP